MLVVVLAVGCVLVAVHEVNMIVVLHCLMAAVGAVGVVGDGVLRDGFVLVVVVTVLVFNDGVLGVNFGGAHGATF